jgi:hypothetical protein
MRVIGAIPGLIFWAALGFWLCCAGGCKNDSAALKPAIFPQVEANGELIRLSPQADTTLFRTAVAQKGDLHIRLQIPSRIVVSVSRSTSEAGSPLILFETPDLTTLYSTYDQNFDNFEKSSRSLERMKNLFAHQSATGTDVEEAQNELLTAEASLKETEGNLRAQGLDPSELKKAGIGVVWMISDVSEADLQNLKSGSRVSVQFSSYPGEKFSGRVESIGDVVDAVTRTVKVRISLPTQGRPLRPGMFGEVQFDEQKDQVICLPATAVVTVLGHDYLFVSPQPEVFRRREVGLGPQTQDSLVIAQGLSPGETVVVEGAMLLKGLSFGY